MIQVRLNLAEVKQDKLKSWLERDLHLCSTKKPYSWACGTVRAFDRVNSLDGRSQ